MVRGTYIDLIRPDGILSLLPDQENSLSRLVLVTNLLFSGCQGRSDLHASFRFLASDEGAMLREAVTRGSFAGCPLKIGRAHV